MLRSLRRLGRSSSLHPRGTGPYLQAPQRRRALERPGITAREGHGELTAFDVEAGRGAAGASELSGFALRLARRTRAAEGSDAGLREAWSSVAFQTEGLIQALSLEEAYDLLRALSKGGVLTRFTSCVKRLMTHVADQEEFLRPRKVLTLWRLLDRADLIDAVEATSYFEKELKFAYKLEVITAATGMKMPMDFQADVVVADPPECQMFKAQSYSKQPESRAQPSSQCVDSPTQRMSDLSPTSATSPTSRSRVESGNTTTMMEDEDVDWLQRVWGRPVVGQANATLRRCTVQVWRTQAVGAKNASERDQLSKELGGVAALGCTINLMLDVEQEELNREELRVERISRRISRKQVNDSKLRTSAATAEKMVRSSIHQLKERAFARG
ncbi:Calcium-dependent protein kinase 2 [Durusdinium trenchii]|uniref:Calcium-dependent protein kinase 2 n=1 Tax=Durusdinium trenchii TaxID=1381693 RepID=A0ABP0PZQ8_9DINO